MARMARIVIPNVPHHVTQRGNRRQRVFFFAKDYLEYKHLLGEFSRQSSVRVLAYCLMPNHVHLILEPETEHGLHRALGETHRRYTRYINFRESWRGYLWQGRFSSFPMDESYLWAAIRYVELNPVRAGLCKTPQEWRWSSTRAHISGRADGLVDGITLPRAVGNWLEFLTSGLNGPTLDTLRAHGRTGRPAGSDEFISTLEAMSGRHLRKRKPGRKPR